MLLKKRLFMFLFIPPMLALACTAPALSATPSVVSTLPAPLIANTEILEVTETVPAPASVTPSQTPAPTLLPTASAVVLTLTPSDTATPIAYPTITFQRSTNCRVGPLKNYNLQTSFMEGRYSLAEGRNQDSTWLLVKPSAGPSCWISVSNLKDAGDYSFLPVVDFPPLPEAPFQMVVVTRECGSRNLVVLRWPDISGETGYRIYREGITLSLLKANATEYRDYPPKANSYFYEIESINTYGISVRFSMSVAGCR
jgi:hypothetical protein